MRLQLSKPLAFIDLESTGLDTVNDRIVEISILLLNIDGETSAFTERVNPGIPIPAECSAIHGIKDEDVAEKDAFDKIGRRAKEFMGNADLAGYNSNRFDIPLLVEEFYRHGIEFDTNNRRMIDVQNIFHKMEKRTLEAAYRFYCEKELTNAHSAEADVRATYEVLISQLDRYQELEPTSKFLDEFSKMNKNVDLAGRIVLNQKGQEVFNFGKHKGKTVAAVFESEPSYYDWMIKSDFPQETKNKLTALRLKSLNQKG